MVEVLRKPVFILYCKEFVCYLTRNSGWLRAVFCLWNVSSHGPWIISQHTGTSFALVPLFHGGNVLVKVCVSLTPPRFSWKKSKWESKKWTFKDILHAIMGLYRIRHHIMIVFCLMISQKLVVTSFYWFPCFFFPLHLAGFQIMHPVLTLFLGPRNTPALIFTSLIEEKLRGAGKYEL